MVEPTAFVHNTLNAIWNHKMVGTIYETFFSGIRVYRSCQDELYGQEALMIDIIERLAAFPDLQMTIEDIIWTGSEEQGYRVSVRLYFEGHNTGISRYGPATQQTMRLHALMNARIVSGRFVELWIAEDERLLVAQLGFDLFAAMRSLEAFETFAGRTLPHDMPAVAGEMQRQELFRLSSEKLDTIQLSGEEAVRDVLFSLWNGRQIGLCQRFYSEDFVCQWASGQKFEGRAAYQGAVLAHLATFPDLTFHIDDMIGQRRKDALHLAVGWTMLGTHAGPGSYGIPSGRRVQIAGISQYVIRNQQFVEEHSLWNELRLMQKILQRPAEPDTGTA